MNRQNILSWKKLGIVLFVGAFAVFVLYNVRNNDEFWNASAVNIITILIAIIISYVFVQRKSDIRKQKEIILGLISGLQLQISSEKAYAFSGQTGEEILMRKRDISNKIHILSEVQDTFSLREEVKFICDRFDEYENLISDHITDLDYLCKSQNELRRPLELISTKLVSMSINLYK